MKQLLIGLFIVFYVNTAVNACECDTNRPFLKVAPSTSLIVTVKIIRYVSYSSPTNGNPLSVEAEITEILQGQKPEKELLFMAIRAICAASMFLILNQANSIFWL